MKEAIAVRGLNYSYPDGTQALEDINIVVHEGERVGIVGPNGAGKTTLFLHFNATLKSPDNRVRIFERDIGGLKRKETIGEVGVVFQDPDDQLFMPTIFDDVAFGPINMGLGEDEVKERVEKALSTVGLLGFEDKVPHHMSYGEKKKAALAAVLSMEPRILVLDEPTANLDPRSRTELIGVINELNEVAGMTIVVAMHDVNALPQLSDRVYVMNRRIVAEGSPRSIFSDAPLLRENNLEPPEVFRLFEALECFGYNSDELPLSIDEAIETLTRTVRTEEGHIHLHVHEHVHEVAAKPKSKYNHHVP
ncbi:MAG: energy-coupling factor ABC transporter ATP-binding protein [Methermicoccaceae archaeon]